MTIKFEIQAFLALQYVSLMAGSFWTLTLNLQNWVFYTLRSKKIEVEKLKPLRALIKPALQYCIPRSDEAIDIFVDIISSYQSFIQSEHLHAISLLLGSQWGQSELEELVAGNSGSIQFGRLLLACAERNMEEMINAPNDPNSVQMMRKFI